MEVPDGKALKPVGLTMIFELADGTTQEVKFKILDNDFQMTQEKRVEPQHSAGRNGPWGYETGPTMCHLRFKSGGIQRTLAADLKDDPQWQWWVTK